MEREENAACGKHNDNQCHRDAHAKAQMLAYMGPWSAPAHPEADVRFQCSHRSRQP
jgi:hypothetical protein